MSATREWPLVTPENGPRPAGPPDRCFYCRAPLGERHCHECVCVTKRIEMRFTATLAPVAGLPQVRPVFRGTWELEVPHFWTADDAEFSKNDSSWCASNLLGYKGSGTVTWEGDSAAAWTALEAAGNGPGCLCGVLDFRFVRVVRSEPRPAVDER